MLINVFVIDHIFLGSDCTPNEDQTENRCTELSGKLHITKIYKKRTHKNLHYIDRIKYIYYTIYYNIQ